jgi:riboflavin kinase / FMN adenylyltransferase
VVLPFNERLAAQAPKPSLKTSWWGLGVKYVLVGDDFRFGAQRAGDYAMLDAAGQRLGFDVARMQSYEVHGLRVSSSAVRDALSAGDMDQVAALLGRPYSISGHVVHGRKLGRQLGAESAARVPATAFAPSTCAFRTGSRRPAAFLRCMCTACCPRTSAARGRGQPGRAPSLDPTMSTAAACCSKPTAFDWPEALARSLPGGEAYGKIIRVDLLHKLHDERKYDSLEALTQGIARTATTHAPTLPPCTPRPAARPRATEFRAERPTRSPPFDRLRANGIPSPHPAHPVRAEPVEVPTESPHVRQENPCSRGSKPKRAAPTAPR